MDASRCPRCKKRLMAMTDRTGRTQPVCLKCDNVDPMKTDAAKWANSSLATVRYPPRRRQPICLVGSAIRSAARNFKPAGT